MYIIIFIYFDVREKGLLLYSVTVFQALLQCERWRKGNVDFGSERLPEFLFCTVAGESFDTESRKDATALSLYVFMIYFYLQSVMNPPFAEAVVLHS